MSHLDGCGTGFPEIVPLFTFTSSKLTAATTGGSSYFGLRSSGIDSEVISIQLPITSIAFPHSDSIIMAHSPTPIASSTSTPLLRSPTAMKPIQSSEGQQEIKNRPVDPWEYLINLDEEVPDFGKYPPSVGTYIQLLGRTPELEHLKFDTEQERAAAEQAEGWRILRNARSPKNGESPRGIFFDPAKITAEAVRRYPLMPYLFGVRGESLREVVLRGLTINDGLLNTPGYVRYLKMSPYARDSRTLILSNAIVPLPDEPIPASDPMWHDLITHLYKQAHPVNVITDFEGINDDDNEELVLAAMGERIPPRLSGDHGLKCCFHLDRDMDSEWAEYLDHMHD